MHLQPECAATILAALVTCSLSAQQPAAPPKPASASVIIRVARGSTGGMSGGGDSTVIEPRTVHWERRPAYDWTIKGIPDEHRTCTITKQDWEGLRNSIDERVLAAFTGRNGRRASVDLPDRWAEVDFTDGTKKFTSFGLSNLPPAIAGLLRKIDLIADRCPSETVMIGGGGQPVPTASDVRPSKVVEPIYPQSAKSAGIHGNVVVTLIVDKNGDVETVTAATGNEKLRTAAIEAVQQWKWNPLRLNGKAIRFRTQAVVYFVLDTKSATDAK